MKNKQKLAMAIVLCSTCVLGNVAFAANAPDPANTKGEIIFESSNEATPPVNPELPEIGIDPDPGDGNETGNLGPLSIDFASHFNFGTQKISTNNEIYYASLVGHTLENGTKEYAPNYVQVTDNRGEEMGWSLHLKQDTQFKTTDNKVLTGAQITLANGFVNTKSESEKPTASETIVLDGETGAEQVIMNAKKGSGAGTYVLGWGHTGAGDLNTAKKSVSLDVPGGTTKYAKSYSTSFTWTLSDVVENDG